MTVDPEVNRTFIYLATRVVTARRVTTFGGRGLTVILVALLSTVTHSTRSCWSFACRKTFLMPALMTAEGELSWEKSIHLVV